MVGELRNRVVPRLERPLYLLALGGDLNQQYRRPVPLELEAAQSGCLVSLQIERHEVDLRDAPVVQDRGERPGRNRYGIRSNVALVRNPPARREPCRVAGFAAAAALDDRG